jgi:hypothetical protein
MLTISLRQAIRSFVARASRRAAFTVVSPLLSQHEFSPLWMNSPLIGHSRLTQSPPCKYVLLTARRIPLLLDNSLRPKPMWQQIGEADENFPMG